MEIVHSCSIKKLFREILQTLPKKSLLEVPFAHVAGLHCVKSVQIRSYF